MLIKSSYQEKIAIAALNSINSFFAQSNIASI
jgi:hypothetical protein